MSQSATESCAINTVGTLSCWGGGRGANTIKDGNNANYTGVKAVAMGYVHRCEHHRAVHGPQFGGTVGPRCCIGPNVDPYVATSVVVQRYNSAPLTGVVSLAAGDFLTCALTSGGQMICWGAVAPNSLNGINTISPTEKGNLSARVTSIVCGWNHSCVLVADGSIECWGSNQFGQLGLGHLAAINTGGPNPPSTSVIGGAVFWK